MVKMQTVELDPCVRCGKTPARWIYDGTGELCLECEARTLAQARRQTMRAPVFNCPHCGADHKRLLFTQTKTGDFRGPCPWDYKHSIYVRWIPVEELIAKAEAA